MKTCALIIGVATTACASSSASPSPAPRSGAVVNLVVTASTVEPITTPAAGWLYRLFYDVHETGSNTGATLTLGHWALSNGLTTNDTFSGAGVLQVPHVVAGGKISIEAHLSVLTTAPPASHVDYTLTYTGDDGQTGSASTGADISRVPKH